MTSAASAHRKAAPSRAALYNLLADLLSYPETGLAGALAVGELSRQVTELVSGLPYPIETDPAGLTCEVEPVSLESEFIRLFDAPVMGSTVALYGGVHQGDRKAVMEELLRFYRHFGVSTADAAINDLPDAIPTVFEFMGYLVQLEAAASEADVLASIRQAERDLLARHVNVWLPKIDGKLALAEPMGCYRTVVKLAREFTAGELAALS